MASVHSADWRAVCEKFTTVLELTELKSLSDPENEPFRSKYEARELLREIYSSLKSFEAREADGGGEDEQQQEQQQEEQEEQQQEQEQEEAVDAEKKDGRPRRDGHSPAGLRTAKLAAVEYYLGVNHAETEELSAGQEHLMNSLKLLDTCSVSPVNVALCIHVRNRLGIIWSARDETETAQGFLEAAEAIYQRYMKEDGSPPTDMTEYFSTEENHMTHQERTNRFELVYTFTMYYLAQVYKYIGETERAATYCHSTLQRQLQLNKFNHMEWALNAATLSQYYITKGLYMEGRHCLAAATVISGLAGEAPSEAAAEESESERDLRDDLRQKRASISRCWIKYCRNLLQDAKKLLQDNTDDLDEDRQEELRGARRGEEEKEEKRRKSALLFGSEDTFDSIASLEEKVPCLFPLNFAEARAVFLVGQTYVTQAKEYFEMDGFVTDHIEILQDHSALFRTLLFFEDDLERRCKMHKRRVDMLEPICNDLNSQYYLMIRRQLMFELAETYNEMMDLKLTLANRQAFSETLDGHTIKKFNHLCAASTKFFEMFLESLRSPEGKLPEKLEEEVLRPVLVARFRVARLYYRLICSEISDQVDNLNKALENYKYVVQYCEANPEASSAAETELELSQEMASLLPIKINQLKAKLISNN